MADDLDAFFDEVSAVEQEAAKEDERSTDEAGDDGDELAAPPPSKKAKTMNARPPPPPRIKGVVVAAASSKVIIPKQEEESDKTASVGPALPSAPGPSSISALPPHSTSATTTTNAAASSISALSDAAATAVAPSSSGASSSKPHVRTIAGKVWVDSSLSEWPDNDFRLFVGNIAPDVTDEAFFLHFANKYTSCQRAKIIRDTGKGGVSKGYGFVSLSDALECAKAIREMDQTWLSSRPIKVKRSNWKERELVQVKKKEKKVQKMHKRLGIL